MNRLRYRKVIESGSFGQCIFKILPSDFSETNHWYQADTGGRMGGVTPASGTNISKSSSMSTGLRSLLADNGVIA